MKWFSAICIVIASVIVAIALGGRPAPLTGKESATLLVAGRHEIATLQLDLNDSTRPTSANGDYPARASRALPSTVWFPADGGRYPLIVSSHGFSSLRQGADYIAKALAQLGYVVIAADYPLTNFFAKGGPRVLDVINQPADVSFLIDEMLLASNDSTHPLHSKIDAERIGVMGISLGGMTSTMVGFDPHRRDPRIKAVVSIAGPSAMFGERYYQNAALPFLMVATPTDAIVNYDDNALPVLRRVPGATLVTIDNVSHTGFASPATYMWWLSNPDIVGCTVVTHNLADDVGSPNAWLAQLGGSDDGVLADHPMRICQTDPLPQTQHPVHQHWLTQLAVTSFFEAQFAADATTREQRWRYLTEVLPSENADVHVESARQFATADTHTTQMADEATRATP